MLLNNNWESASINPNLPIWFCDVDGVLNGMPFEQRWVGPENFKPEFDFEILNPKYWETFEIEPDLEHFFPLDNKVTVSFNKNAYLESFPPKYQNLTIRYSSELMERIAALVHAGKVNFVWLTTWQSEAIRLLNPMFGLPEDTPFLNWNHTSDLGQVRKGWALADYYEKLENKPKFVWVDDVATENFVNSGLTSTGMYPIGDTFPHMDGVESLIIQTDGHWGISRAEIDLIENFLKSEGE